jgi:hypothetical protein
MRSAALLLATGALGGCAYYNGIYNARQAERRGDALMRAGRSMEADSLHALAATRAESVLAHHTGSHWASQANLIAGWSWAMAARCDKAEPRLAAVRERSSERAAQLERATLALGVCRVRQGREAEARSLLAPLADLPDRQLAREASLWAALASVNLGEPDSARAYLRGADDARAEWEITRALLGRGEFAAAESLLERRAAHRDFRPDLLGHLRVLWRAGRAAGVYRVVLRYDEARAPARDRARLHLLTGELALAAGQDSTARAHLATARRLARDTLVAREAGAHLTLAELADLESLVDAANVIDRGRDRAAGHLLQRRLEDNFLLVRMLHDHDDASGAALFLAAEVARDSLRAPMLARILFDRVALLPRSPLSAKALAAAQLTLASDHGNAVDADALIPGAAFGEIGRAARADGASTVDPTERLLLDVWRTVSAQHADSVSRLRPARSGGTALADSTARTRPPTSARPTEITPR